MTSFIHRTTRAFAGRRSRVRLTHRQWHDLIVELGRRAGGVRESGAFLLTDLDRGSTVVRRVVYFDDVDPDCLTDGISMSSAGLSALWRICREERMRVIADVHTHPDTGVGQSPIDRANPMVATVGHVAVIVPHLAARVVNPGDCGVHVYQGNHQWDSSFTRDAARLLYVGRWA